MSHDRNPNRPQNQEDTDLVDQGRIDSVKGKTKNAIGQVKDAAGGLTGDVKLKAEGKMDRVIGAAQDALGKAERKVGGTD